MIIKAKTMKKFANVGILSTSSIIDALEKNIDEEKILQNYCLLLQRQLNIEITNIDKDLYTNQQYYYDINYQKLIMNNIDEEINRDKVNPTYFDLISLKLKDSSNFFAPYLLKSVKQQEINASRTFRDIINACKERRSKKDSNEHVNFPGKHQNIFFSEPEENTKLPNITPYRAVKSAYAYDEDLKKAKSIRRDRNSARQINENYQSKYNI
jgi:hypothetical protein